MGIYAVEGRLLVKRDDGKIHWVTINGKHIPIGMSRSEAKVRTTLRKLEDKIRSKKVEHGYIVGVNGKVLWKGSGKSNFVGIENAIERNLLKGNIFTHNHPRGMSLSGHDVNNMINHRMRFVRAVSKSFDYEIHPPKSFDYSEKSINEFWNLYWDIREEEEDKLLGLIIAGKTSAEKADAEIDHLVWERMSNEFDMRYRRKSRNE